MLQETLRSWLRNLGDRAVMLEELDLHPAGWALRTSRLDELFGRHWKRPGLLCPSHVGPGLERGGRAWTCLPGHEPSPPSRCPERWSSGASGALNQAGGSLEQRSSPHLCGCVRVPRCPACVDQLRFGCADLAIGSHTEGVDRGLPRKGRLLC